MNVVHHPCPLLWDLQSTPEGKICHHPSLGFTTWLLWPMAWKQVHPGSLNCTPSFHPLSCPPVSTLRVLHQPESWNEKSLESHSQKQGPATTTCSHHVTRRNNPFSFLATALWEAFMQIHCALKWFLFFCLFVCLRACL